MEGMDQTWDNARTWPLPLLFIPIRVSTQIQAVGSAAFRHAQMPANRCGIVSLMNAWAMVAELRA